jgi:predicted nuclease of predicted toxin-antitoxin system
LKFKTDENVPAEAAELLRSAGFDALTVLEQVLGGANDSAVSGICREEDRILVTLDTDFADVRAYPPRDHPGIIVLRLKRQDKSSVLRALSRAMRAFPFESVEGKLWIVEEERVRIREG